MNKLALIFILLMISFFSEAGETTGAGKEVQTILMANNYSTKRLNDLGLSVRLGEVTGAGKVHVDDLRMLVTKKGIYQVDNLHGIEFNHPSAGKFVKEIKKFSFPAETVKKNKVLAYIISK